eukprot:gene2955-biopygen5202
MDSAENALNIGVQCGRWGLQRDHGGTRRITDKSTEDHHDGDHVGSKGEHWSDHNGITVAITLGCQIIFDPGAAAWTLRCCMDSALHGLSFTMLDHRPVLGIPPRRYRPLGQ